MKSDGNVRASMIEYKLVSSLQAGTHVVEVLKVTEDNTDSISTETKTVNEECGVCTAGGTSPCRITDVPRTRTLYQGGHPTALAAN